MYYFVYQADRHTRYRFGYRRLSATTIRNDFNLDTMRAGLKGHYTIHGYTTHPFHSLLKSMNLQDLMMGHIIEIPEAKYAVWLKLNYDQIGKGRTKYIASYKGISEDDLIPFSDRLTAIQADAVKVQSDSYSLRSMQNGFENFLNRKMSGSCEIVPQETWELTSQLKTQLDELCILNSEKLTELNRQATQIKHEVTQYLKDHEM